MPRTRSAVVQHHIPTVVRRCRHWLRVRFGLHWRQRRCRVLGGSGLVATLGQDVALDDTQAA